MNFKKYLSRLKKSIETKKVEPVEAGETVIPSPELELPKRKLPFAPTDEMLWEREKKRGEK